MQFISIWWGDSNYITVQIHWRLRDTKSTQISKNLQIIIIIHSLELFTSALDHGLSLESEWLQVSSSPGLFLVFWPFSTMQSFGWSPLVRQLPKFSSPFSNPLVTVPNAPITIGIIVTCIFHSFFNFLARSRYLSYYYYYYCSFASFSHQR